MADRKIRDIEVGIAHIPRGAEPLLLFTIDKKKLTFKNNNHPGFTVRFNISDPENSQYKFPADPAEAMWVQTIEAAGPDSCPTTAMHWSGFQATSVTNDNMTLEVQNPNAESQLFAFTLRFTKTPDVANSPCEPFDPIGTNRNGADKSNAPAILAAVVLVGVACLAAYQLLS